MKLLLFLTTKSVERSVQVKQFVPSFDFHLKKKQKMKQKRSKNEAKTKQKAKKAKSKLREILVKMARQKNIEAQRGTHDLADRRASSEKTDVPNLVIQKRSTARWSIVQKPHKRWVSLSRACCCS